MFAREKQSTRKRKKTGRKEKRERRHTSRKNANNGKKVIEKHAECTCMKSSRQKTDRQTDRQTDKFLHPNGKLCTFKELMFTVLTSQLYFLTYYNITYSYKYGYFYPM